MVKIFSQNVWQMMTFLNPLDSLIPKIPFSFFADFRVWLTSEAPGVSLVRILGVPSIEPLIFGGWSSHGALSTPPPPLN